jgi:DNA damage-binding protein 1
MTSIREQNLLSLAFHPGQPTAHGPVVSMLWLSPSNQLRLQFRAISTTEQSLHNLGKDRDVVRAESNQSDQDEDTDFGSIPFACPGARHIIPVPGIDDERLALVVGDEFSVLYSFSQVGERERTSSISQSTSPRASAVNRSPQTEARQIGKRRKSSTSEGGRRWELKPIWRMRQGFGTVLA